MNDQIAGKGWRIGDRLAALGNQLAVWHREMECLYSAFSSEANTRHITLQ